MCDNILKVLVLIVSLIGLPALITYNGLVQNPVTGVAGKSYVTERSCKMYFNGELTQVSCEILPNLIEGYTYTVTMNAFGEINGLSN